MSKRIKKSLSAILAACVLFATISFPVSAAWTTTGDGTIGYPDHITNLAANADGLYKVTYVDNASGQATPAARSVGTWNALTGFHLEFSDIVMAGNDKYAMELNFGNTPNSPGQNIDRAGFTVVYTYEGKLSIFKSTNGFAPAPGDTNAIVQRIEPLTGAGFNLDIQMVSNTYYSITVTTPTASHTYLFNATNVGLGTYALLYGTFTLTTGGTSSSDVTKKDSTFKFKYVDNLGFAKTVPSNYMEANNTSEVHHEYRLDSNGKQVVRRKNAGLYWNNVRTASTFNAASSNGITVKLSDMMAGKTPDYAIAVVFSANVDGENYLSFANQKVPSLLFIYEPDGTWALAEKKGDSKPAETASWNIYETGKDANANIINSIEINLKKAASGSNYTFTFGETEIPVDNALYGYSSFIVGVNVLGHLTIDTNADTVTWGRLYNDATAMSDLMPGGYDFVQFTIDEIVDSIALEGISMKQDKVTLKAEETYQLQTEMLPMGANNPGIKYTSSTPSVATVDETTGVVTAVASGTTTITATTADNVFTDTCTVSVVSFTTDVPSGYKGSGAPTGAFEYAINSDSKIVLRRNSVSAYYTALHKTDMLFANTTSGINVSLTDIQDSISDDYTIAVGFGSPDWQGTYQNYTTQTYAMILFLYNSDGNYAIVKKIYNKACDAADAYEVLKTGTVAEPAALQLNLKKTGTEYHLTYDNESTLVDQGIGVFSAYNTLYVTMGVMGGIEINTDTVTVTGLQATASTNMNQTIPSGKYVQFTIDELSDSNKPKPVKYLSADAPYVAFMTGSTDNSTLFKPAEALTRGDAIMAMAKLMADEETISAVSITSDYTDLDSNAPYYQYVLYMEKNDYLPDCFAGTTLSAGNAITRGELVALFTVESGSLNLTADTSTITRGDAAKAICVFVGKTEPVGFAPTTTFTDVTVAGDTRLDGELETRDLVRLKKDISKQAAYTKADDIDNSKVVDTDDVVVINDLLVGNTVASDIVMYETYIKLATNRTEASVQTVKVKSVSELKNAVATANNSNESVVKIEIGNDEQEDG